MARATNRPTGDQPRAEKRPPRVNLSGSVDILEVGNKDPNNVYRWVNDEKSKIQRYEAAWWDKVTGKEVQLALGARDASVGDDSPVVQEVGHHKNGEPKFAYLMRKEKKYFDEDYALKQAKIDEQEKSLFRSDKSFEKGQYGEVKQVVSRSR